MGFFNFINKMDPSVKKNLANVALSLLKRTNVSAGDVIIGGITLPIPPESFQLSVNNNNDTVNIQNAGDIALLGKTGLKTITIESFLPGTDNTYTEAVDAYNIIDSLEDIRLSGKPTNLLIAGTNIEMDCIINNFSYGEKDGSGDVYFSISLVEYRELSEPLETALNSSNGLKKRKSLLNEMGVNLTYRPGDHLGDTVRRAFLKSDLSNEKIPPIVKALVKNKKLNIGDVVTVKDGQLQINNDSFNVRKETTATGEADVKNTD